jgi:CheY-like chemotaxis protein
VQISVADTGVGMTSDIRSRIFEPFFTTKARGTGLGLATVYGIVKQCGGAVSVYSEPDHGSVFKVYLPACTESVRLETIAPMSESRGGNETVLLAEDESSYRNLIHEVLTNKGYKVLVAKDGKEATNILSGASNVDLLLTDSVMPSAAGAILVKEAKKQFPDIKIIMMSGYTDRTLEIETVAADLFLQKPFTPSELLAQVREILDGQP